MKCISPVEKFVIRKRMKDRGVSTKDLAKLFNVSLPHVRNVLCGSIKSRSLLNRIARLFALPDEPDFGFVSYTPETGLPPGFPDGGIIVIPKAYATALNGALSNAAAVEIPPGEMVHVPAGKFEDLRTASFQSDQTESDLTAPPKP